MKLRLSRIHHPVTALGPGVRVGVWVQGCSLRCRGCMARDTWDPEGGEAVEVAALATHLTALLDTDSAMTGLTISGGEPLEQAAAVHDLLGELQPLRDRVDILMYSGLNLTRIRNEHPWVMDCVDALIPEPFVQQRAPGQRWRGSANQPLVLNSPLARERFRDFDQAGPQLQVAIENGELRLIGVPRPGDLDRLVELANARGLHIGDVSWH